MESAQDSTWYRVDNKMLAIIIVTKVNEGTEEGLGWEKEGYLRILGRNAVEAETWRLSSQV